MSQFERVSDPVRVKRLAAEINQNEGDVFLNVKRVSIGLLNAKTVILIEEQDGTAIMLPLPVKVARND